jgi:hypothetical protein
MPSHPPRGDLPPEPTDFFRTYGSALALTAANVYVVFPTVMSSWPLAELMWVYWLQSVIIGAAHVLRILSLQDFEIGEDFKILGRAVRKGDRTKGLVAGLFALHYGFIHFAFMVLMAMAFKVKPTEFDGFLIAGALFAVTHAFAFVKQRPALAVATPDLGTLMWFPYVRILPMFFTILIGIGFLGPVSEGAVAATLLFILLKTIADVGMHLIEERRIRTTG